jgi:hypothetical protein
MALSFDRPVVRCGQKGCDDDVEGGLGPSRGLDAPFAQIELGIGSAA